jgi:signal transduction histidine kinase
MAVKRGERITLEVTRFTRPAEPILRPIAAHEWMSGLMDEMQSVLARRSRGSLELQLVPAETNALVAADAEQLHQVFSNLLNNAADAMPDGGRITVSVKEAAGDEPGSWIHFQVRDTGAGIAPAVLDRIFEPLFTTKHKGTGLGLAVAHQIIKAHGGRMSVETAVGQGTTFHVFLRALAS